MSLLPMWRAYSLARPGGLLACNVIQLEHAEAIVAAATSTGRPVVLQISENTVLYHGSLAPLASACLRLASAAAAGVAVHLDHATSEELVAEAVELGIGSVMYDASRLPYEENVAATGAITSWCHERGVWVEAELGEVGGKDGVHAPGARTDPDQARSYAGATGVNALAVAVGSSHAMLTREARLDNELISAIASTVSVPLVLHGSSGVPDDGLVAAVKHGITKVNIATRLNEVMTDAVREVLVSEPRAVDPRVWIGPARSAISAEAQRLLMLLA